MHPAAEWMTGLVRHLCRQVIPDDDLAALSRAPLGEAIFAHPDDDLGPAMAVAADGLGTLTDPVQVCRLGFLCGILIENGAPTDRIAPPLAEATARVFATTAALLDDLGEPTDEDAAAILASGDPRVRSFALAQYIGLAAMTCLCRDRAGRARGRAIDGFAESCDRIEVVVPTGFYLRELLGAVDDLELVVVHAERRRGYQVVADGVRNGFHLFTLLHGALIGDPGAGWLEGTPLPPGQLAFARGETHERVDRHDRARWLFLTGRAWSGAGLRDDPQAYLAYGEPSVAYLPIVAGQRVLLLSDTPLARSWDANFFASLHEAHRAEVRVVRHLAEHEVDGLLARIAADNEAPGP